MDRYLMNNLAYLLKTGFFMLHENGNIETSHDDEEKNPLYQSEELRGILLRGIRGQREPYIYRDSSKVYFAGFQTEEGVFLIGPMATEYLDRAKRRVFCRMWKVSEDYEKNMHQRSIMEVLQIVCTMCRLLTGAEYADHDLVIANRLLEVSEEEAHVEAVKFTLRSDEEEMYRHSYQEERNLLNMVREGNVAEAMKRTKELDREIGRLSSSDLGHWRNILVIGATLCARAAIEGGIPPYVAYRISGFYINKGMECRDSLQVLNYRNQAIEDLTQAVRDQKIKRHTSSYTEQCKDYVRKHFREKIYLEDLAEQMGISSSYLSRLFKKETGICLQDYINEVRVERAANLLIYSEESIASIAEYVNFPSQSYLGKIFKNIKGMTPRQYREQYKPAEFIKRKTEKE